LGREEAYQLDGDGPLVDGEVDLPGEVVEMAYQTRHYLGQARVSFGPRRRDDLVSQGEIIALLVTAEIVLGFADRADIDGRVR